MFIQREEEIKILEDEYSSANSTIQFIFGAKNSGKTTLLQKFSKEKDTLYFSNCEMLPAHFFTQMANIISNYFHGIDTVGKPFNSFYELLVFLQEQNIEKKLVIIFDDFQNILKVDKNGLDELLKLWKASLRKKNIQLLISSSNLFSDDKYKEICNISGANIRLKYLDFLAIKEFLPNINKLDQLYIYSLLGTSPSNLKYYNPKIEFTENIYNLFLTTNAYLFEYGIRILKTEISDIGTYSSILYAIAKGNSKVGDIATFLDVKPTHLSRYLQKLIDMMILDKSVPLGEDKKNSKFGRYIILDNTLKFWFSYIFPNFSALQQNNVKEVSKIIQDEFIRKTVFSSYKSCIKEYIDRKQETIFGYKPILTGAWWDNQNNSIDLIAYNKKYITFVQILWEEKDMAQIAYSKLKNASEKFETSLEKKYLIITKNTFFNIN
ncbi:MAG: ATP-binding protein [Halarcobacter sp.]